MSKIFKISGVGCSLVDRLYRVSYGDSAFTPYLSRARGDGGLNPGQLVFREDFEKSCSDNFHLILAKLTSNRPPEKINIGGPGIVSMIHASQLSRDVDCEFHFYGIRGDDEDGAFIMSLTKNTPLNTSSYITSEMETPSTLVLSDPDYQHGDGERIFINSIAAAWEYKPMLLDDTFFDSDIVVFGATALLPNLHDNLTELLVHAVSKGCITVVNTVYDFRNEQLNPHLKWPLGSSDESYRNIDLLVTDYEEALRLSGTESIQNAMRFFRKKGAGAVIITRGAKNVSLFSTGILFKQLDDMEMPVSKAVAKSLTSGFAGDTTGCGDNFAGGVIASLTSQVQKGETPPCLVEACTWGIVSGGTACFYMGGMYEEKEEGEKLKMIEPFYHSYKKQLEL